MKNRKMLLPSLLSIALVFSLTLPASVAGASAAVPVPDDHIIISYEPQELQESQVDIKAGDWVKIKYTTIGWPEPYPEWMKLEFLSVEGTTANARVTLHISNGTEESDTVPVDLAAGGGEAFILSGFVVPPNLTTGDSFYMSGFGNVTIAGETTIYAAARRTVVYAGLSSEYAGYFTYYWDKLTGVMVEAFTTSPRMTLKATVTETNMWEAVPPNVGIKAGDWIKMKYNTSRRDDEQIYPEWVKLEFLSVESTNATTQATKHWNVAGNITEQSDTAPVDVVAGGTILGLSGVVISANLTTGDSVYMTGLRFDGLVLGPDYGEVAIKGETTRTYAGARRTVVYASVGNITQIGSQKYGSQTTYYWDKLTGVIVEQSTTSADGTATTYKVTETNMWEATTAGMPWWPWIIVAAAVVALAIAVYRLKKRKTPTTPTPPAEGT